MKDKDKTKEQLINELEGMREQIAKLDASEVEQEQDGKTSSLSEKEYKRFFDLVPIGVTMLDMKGVVLYCNAAVYNKGGYPEDSFIGKHFTKIASVRLQDIPTYIRVFNSIVMGKVPKQFESVYQRNDGTTGWTELSISLLELGRKRRILVMQHDITERKQMEEALQQSEGKYRASFEDPTLANVYFDVKGRLALVNQKATQIIGKPVKDIVGKHVKDVYPARPNNIYWERVRRALEKGETVEHTDFIESTDKWFLTRIVPISDASGTIIGALASTRDITEQKQTDTALIESESKYRNLAENLDELVYRCNPKTFFSTYVNKSIEKMYGYTVEEWLKDPTLWESTIHPDDKERVFADLAEANKISQPYIHEYRILRKDKEVRWVEDHLTWEKDQQGNPVSINGVIYDITERKQTEEREKQLTIERNVAGRLATVGEMAAGIAHEINNPLTGVIGFSDLLLKKKDLPEDIKKDMDIIHEGARRIASIVDRMLRFSRQIQPETKQVNINDVIGTTLAMRASEMKTSNIELTTRLAPDLPLIHADAGLLQQVFLNITLNAEQAMKEAHGQGKLTVETKRIDNNIRISFKDDGPGITKENMGRLFNPFFTTKDPDKGTGLGLSISHSIVVQHNGKIYAENKLGKGATFFVELPIVDKGEQLKTGEPAALKPESASRARILLVDDDPIIQEYITTVLTEEGHEVEIVDKGDDAIRKLGSEDYGAILLDVKLPGMSGIEIYEQLQKSSKPLTSKVIFITGDVMNLDTMVYIKSSQTSYIAKPFDAEKLIEEIDRIISQ
ncbi:PAS domain S-box protein [Chloroflexota bacterium]